MEMLQGNARLEILFFFLSRLIEDEQKEERWCVYHRTKSVDEQVKEYTPAFVDTSDNNIEICRAIMSINPEEISTIFNVISLGAATLCHEYPVHSLGAHLT